MTTLHNYPIVNQLVDGNEANKDFDCVSACITSAIDWYAGKHLRPGEPKDVVYGNGYAGGTDPARYVHYVDGFNITMAAFTGSKESLINEAHHQIQSNHPVLFIRDDPYWPGHPDATHACIFYGEFAGHLVAMDPFGGKSITQFNSVWLEELRGNLLWVFTPKRKPAPTPPKPPERTPSMNQQAHDIWNSFLQGIGRPTLPMDTGISQSWFAHYPTLNPGSPLGPEIHTVDWNGASIQVQYFSGGIRCEWDNTHGGAKWYDAHNSQVA